MTASLSLGRIALSPFPAPLALPHRRRGAWRQCLVGEGVPPPVMVTRRSSVIIFESGPRRGTEIRISALRRLNDNLLSLNQCSAAPSGQQSALSGQLNLVISQRLRASEENSEPDTAGWDKFSLFFSELTADC